MTMTDDEVDQLRDALDSVGHTAICKYWRDEYRCTCNMVEVEAALAMLDAKAVEKKQFCKLCEGTHDPRIACLPYYGKPSQGEGDK